MSIPHFPCSAAVSHPKDTGKLPAYRQSQAGAAEAAGNGTVNLLECLENLLMIIRRDADAGIGDRHGDTVFRSQFTAAENSLRSRLSEMNTDLTFFRKLDAVGYEIFTICSSRCGSEPGNHAARHPVQRTKPGPCLRPGGGKWYPVFEPGPQGQPFDY